MFARSAGACGNQKVALPDDIYMLRTDLKPSGVGGWAHL